MFRPETDAILGEPVSVELAPVRGQAVSAKVRPITADEEIWLAVHRGQTHVLTANALETLVLNSGVVKLSHENLSAGDLLLGDRNRLVLAVLCVGYGAPRDLLAHCAACETTNELPFDPARVLRTVPQGPVGETFFIGSGDTRLQMRLPTGADVAAEGALVERCAPGIREPDELRQIEAELAARDPCAEIRIGMKCVGCGSGLDNLLDPLALLLTEMDRCGGIFAEIDRVARSYHWSEAELRALPAHRRRLYLKTLEDALFDTPQVRAS